MKWHVIYTKVREKFGAHENLQNQGFEDFLLTCQVQKTTVSYSIYSWVSVDRGGLPVGIPDAILEFLRERCYYEEPSNELIQPR